MLLICTVYVALPPDWSCQFRSISLELGLVAVRLVGAATVAATGAVVDPDVPVALAPASANALGTCPFQLETQVLPESTDGADALILGQRVLAVHAGDPLEGIVGHLPIAGPAVEHAPSPVGYEVVIDDRGVAHDLDGGEAIVGIAGDARSRAEQHVVVNVYVLGDGAAGAGAGGDRQGEVRVAAGLHVEVRDIVPADAEVGPVVLDFDAVAGDAGDGVVIEGAVVAGIGAEEIHGVDALVDVGDGVVIDVGLVDGIEDHSVAADVLQRVVGDLEIVAAPLAVDAGAADVFDGVVGDDDVGRPFGQLDARAGEGDAFELGIGAGM